MKRILFLFLPYLPYLATAQVAKDTVTVLTLAQIPAGAIRDTTNFTFVQDNAFRKATFDSLAKYTRVKLVGDRGDITVSGATGLTWELDAGVVDSMQLSAGAVVLPGAKVTGTLPVGKGGTGTPTQFTPGSVVFAGASGVYSQSNSQLFWNSSDNRLGIGTSSPSAKLAVSQNTSSANAAAYNVVNTTTAASGFANFASNITQNIAPSANTPPEDADYGSMNIASSYNNGNGSVGRFVYGLQASAYNASTGTLSNVFGANYGAGNYDASGAVTNAIGNRVAILNFAGTITNAYGFRFAGKVFNSGTITNAYGLYIDNVNFGATTNYAIFSAGGNVRLAGLPTSGTHTYDVRSNSSGDLFFGTPSDESYKKNIDNLKYGINDVMKLNPVQFNWVGDDSYDVGFVAQDFYNTIPELVYSAPDGKLGIEYEKLIAVLTKAIQEQQQQIEQLKQRITQLENK